MQDRLANGKKIRILKVIDEFTRKCLKLKVGYTNPTEGTMIRNVNLKQNTTPARDNGLKQDIFVKSSSTVSFKGMDSSPDIKPSSETIWGFKGAALFLIPLIAAAALAKGQNPDDIFLPDGTYVGRVDELFVNTKKAEELGFDLNPDNYEIKDISNGVFKDFNTGTKIDFLEGKYINPQKIIFLVA